MNFKLSIFFILLCINNIISAQKPEFFREEISFGIDTAFFSVDGDYYFRNSSDKFHSYTIAYPIPGNSSEDPIDMISVFDQDDPANPLKIDIHDTIVNFLLKMPPQSVKTIKVFYRQRHNGHFARYILLTTKWWEKPFESAAYNLTVGKETDIHDFSIKPDKSIVFGETEVFYWERENFMPECDFEIKFTLKQK